MWPKTPSRLAVLPILVDCAHSLVSSFLKFILSCHSFKSLLCSYPFLFSLNSTFWHSILSIILNFTYTNLSATTNSQYIQNNINYIILLSCFCTLYSVLQLMSCLIVRILDSVKIDTFLPSFILNPISFTGPA